MNKNVTGYTVCLSYVKAVFVRAYLQETHEKIIYSFGMRQILK